MSMKGTVTVGETQTLRWYITLAVLGETALVTVTTVGIWLHQIHSGELWSKRT
jgi:hypothetical protein